MPSLSRSDREAILQEVCRLVETKHFNPKLNGVDWDFVVEARRDRILWIESSEEFEKEMHELVSQLKTSQSENPRERTSLSSFCATGSFVARIRGF